MSRKPEILTDEEICKAVACAKAHGIGCCDYRTPEDRRYCVLFNCGRLMTDHIINDLGYISKEQLNDLLDTLKSTRRLVWAQSEAEHMMDGFGPRSKRPTDDLLARVDAMLAKYLTPSEESEEVK